jgi:hypothetical protein
MADTIGMLKLMIHYHLCRTIPINKHRFVYTAIISCAAGLSLCKCSCVAITFRVTEDRHF